MASAARSSRASSSSGLLTTTSPLLLTRSSVPTCKTIFISSVAAMAASRLACLLNLGCSDHAERPGCRAECGIMSRRLVQEMTHAGEDHGEAEAIGGGYDIVV